MGETPSYDLQQAPKLRTGGRSARIGRDVMRATIDILSEGGVDELTFENVAARANVNRATLYRRWESKPRLLTWAMLEFMAEQVPTPDHGNLLDDLVEVMLNLDSALNSPVGAGFFQVIAIDARKDATVGKAVAAYWQQRFRLAEKLLRRGVERGELDPAVDSDLLLDQVFGPFFYRTLRGGGRITAKQAKRLVAHALASFA